jgi:hypothetical protein
VDWAAPLLAQAGELDSGIASLRRARDLMAVAIRLGAPPEPG